MNRRLFLRAATLASLLPLLGGSSEPAPPAPIRRFHRFDQPNDRWVEIEFEAIVAGDHVWIDDGDKSEVVLVSEGVAACKEKGCCPSAGEHFHNSARIDPKTNQWVYR